MKPPKISALILAKGKPPPGKDMGTGMPDEEEAMPSDLEMAAGDAISAVKSGDAAAFAEALKNFMTIHSSESSETDLGGEEEAY